MQSPDVNVLVSAFRQDAVHHALCRKWLLDAFSGRNQVGLSELVLSGVLRVLTHAKVFHPPTPCEEAAAFVDALLARRQGKVVLPGNGHWRIFRGMTVALRLTGNRIPDAYHAALSMEHGCEWVTLDRGFSIFPGLRVVNLLDVQ